MDYEWDENKRIKNATIHSVDFEIIRKFDWASSISIPDERFREKRYLALGLIFRRLYALAYTVRNNKIRVISLRKANKREVRKYESYLSRQRTK